ncbi:hypothetical protein [Paenibacillus sp. LK1]|uniref:hypothetical protein n=1 Tax=Paenibacillus sp. LK1 TaxID=2053014 RepID=UPI000C189DC7|nr:hypothetical protein [Paenibacillus sp. LK1]PIH59697.1 hypothetical protein CS562_07085 [Paenibacillus sp. LK1]
MEEKEYYEAHERVKIAMYSYELKNPDVEYLYATEYELEQGKVLVKYMRDQDYLVVIRCFEWEIDFDNQVEVSKFKITDFNVFVEIFSNGELNL